MKRAGELSSNTGATIVGLRARNTERSNYTTFSWKKRPVRLKKIVSRMKQPRVLFVLGLLAIAALGFSVHYYTVLSAEIDSRLKGGFFDNSVGIFTSPFKVSVGDRLSKDELVGYLKAAGYQETSQQDDAASSRFRVKGDAVEIIPAKLVSAELGLVPVRIEIDKSDRVAALTSTETGKRVDSAGIEGELLASVRGDNRRKKIEVSFAEIPEHLRHAVLAVEDRRFFSHNGIDWRGIARALRADLDQGGIVQGGSTITQQLIKNAFLSSDRTIGRKLKEAAMAVILESRLSKEEIFTIYCNDVYLGQSGTFAVHGFGEAAQVYFEKNISDLTLGESAFLAGLIHAPNRYSTNRDLQRAIERRNIVLDSMTATEAVTADEAARAKAEPLKVKTAAPAGDYGTNYFIDYVQRFLEQRYGDAGPLQQRVYTTMDPRLQRAAFEAVTRQTGRLEKSFAKSARKGSAQPKLQAALVALDAHTGEVLAMVGGRDYNESQLNRATDARRQPGSTFKPFVYAAALGMRSYTPATLISDRPQTFSFDGGRAEYKPSNYHGAYSNRDVTLREALTRSLNIPAVELAMRVGLGNISDLAQECGMERPRAYPSMALGASEVTPLELAASYTAFANEGLALRPVPVKNVADSRKVSRVSAQGTRVFSPQVAYLLTNLMQSVVDSGTASQVRASGIKGAVAGKTGTSNDGWFVAYTPNMVCVVWVGFDDNTDLRLKASDSALPIWTDFMKEALELRPALGGDNFSRPGGIVTAEIDPTTGFLATPDCEERRQEIFISGTQPYATCSHDSFSDEELLAASYDGTGEPSDVLSSGYGKVTLTICAESGRLASGYCPRTKSVEFETGSEPLDLCSGDGHAGGARDGARSDAGDDAVTAALPVSTVSPVSTILTDRAAKKRAPVKGREPLKPDSGRLKPGEQQ